MKKETTLDNIQRINVVILVVGSLLVLFIMRDFRCFYSFAVASAIMALNFKLLRRIIEGAINNISMTKMDLLIKLPLKFLALFALIGVVLFYGNVDMLLFAGGLSTVFLSIIIDQIGLLSFIPVLKRRQKDGT
jgi:hypothetical protein